MRNIPLGSEREVIVADFFEVSLFPLAAVDEGDVIFREVDNRIGFREIGDDGVRVLPGIADHIRHTRFRPARVDLRMACAARGGADVCGLRRLGREQQREEEQGERGRFRHDRV